MLNEQLLIPGQFAIKLVCSRIPQLKKQKCFVIDGLRLTFDLPTAPKIKKSPLSAGPRGTKGVRVLNYCELSSEPASGTL